MSAVKRIKQHLCFTRITKKAAKRILLALAVLSLTFTSGCFQKEGAKDVVLDPHEIGLFQFKGKISGFEPDNSLSPDGKNILVARSDSKGNYLRVISLEAKGKAPAQSTVSWEDAKETTIDSVSFSWIQRNIFSYYPLGWTSDTKVLYAVFGWMNDGPNEGKRGLSIREGDLGRVSSEGKGSHSEIFFREMPKGYCRNEVFLKEKGKAYFTLSATGDTGSKTVLIEFDVATKKERVIKEDLPSYDGLFNPKLSPNGDYYVYDIHEEGRHGIYILNTSTGEEKALIPAGEHLSFLPSWSPDGKHVAAYTAKRLPNQKGQYPYAYDIFPGEDGPLPIGESITVVDVSGNIVKEISVEGKFVSGFKWSPDSLALGFSSGQEKAMDAQAFEGVRTIKHDTLWISSLSKEEKPIKLSDISQVSGDSFVFPVAVSSEKKGLYFNVYVPEKGPSLWYSQKKDDSGSSGKNPVLVGESSMGQDLIPFGKSFLGVVEGQKGEDSLILFSASQSKKLREFQAQGHSQIVGFNKDMAVLYVVTDVESADSLSQIVVYKMTK